MLTIITPTGTRPEAFANCEAMMMAQTFTGPVRWIVIDDGTEPTPLGEIKPGWERIVLRPQPFWSEGQNTQGRNLKVGIAAAREAAQRTGEELRLTVVEDDDAYLPEWLERLSMEMNVAQLVGEGDAIYYNVRFARWKNLGNRRHASLRCSGLRGAAIDALERVLETPHRYYDLRLWRSFDDTHVFFSRLTIGIKAMPGRAGIADGHDGLHGHHDPDGSQLRRLVGPFADLFHKYRQEAAMIRDRFIVLKPFKYPRPNGPSYEPGEEIKFSDHKAYRDSEILLQARMIKRERLATVSPSILAAVSELETESVVVEPLAPAASVFGDVLNVVANDGDAAPEFVYTLNDGKLLDAPSSEADDGAVEDKADDEANDGEGPADTSDTGTAAPLSKRAQKRAARAAQQNGAA